MKNQGIVSKLEIMEREHTEINKNRHKRFGWTFVNNAVPKKRSYEKNR